MHLSKIAFPVLLDEGVAPIIYPDHPDILVDEFILHTHPVNVATLPGRVPVYLETNPPPPVYHSNLQ